MKKVLAIGLTAILTLSCLGGCGKKSQGFTPRMDRKETAQISVAGSWSNFQALEAVINDWNVIYPNVSVTYHKVDGYQEQLAALLAEPTAPEIVMLDADGYYTDKDGIIDALADLSEIGMDTGILSQNVVEGSTVNGKFCTLSWGVEASGFVVNKAILEELNLEVPKTHEDLLEACQVLKDNGYVPIQGCTGSVYTLLMNNAVNYILAARGEKAESLITGQPGCGKILEVEFAGMLDLTRNGYLDPNLNDQITDIYEGSILHFFEGNTPFLAFSTEGFSGMAKRESKSEFYSTHPFAYCFVSLPVSGETPMLGISYLPGLSLVSGSREENWGREFLRFLCQEKELERMAEVKGVPSVTDNGQNENYKFLDEIPKENITAMVVSREAQLVNEVFAKTLEAIARGEIQSVEQAEGYFEARLEEVL